MYNITDDTEVNFCKKFKLFHIFNGDWSTMLVWVTVDAPLVQALPVLITRTETSIHTEWWSCISCMSVVTIAIRAVLPSNLLLENSESALVSTWISHVFNKGEFFLL